MTLSYNEVDDMVKIIAEIPKNAYLGLGWGHNMFNIDMITFHAGETLEECLIVDRFSYKNETPPADPT
jgi:hypothetical protein